MTFLRLSRWDWIAFVAALGLLLVMSADWYTTKQGEECRRIEQLQPPSGSGASFSLGDDVVHASLGDGVVIGVEPGVAIVRFESDGSERKLMVDYAPLKLKRR